MPYRHYSCRSIHGAPRGHDRSDRDPCPRSAGGVVRGTVLLAVGLAVAGRVGSRTHRRACGSFGYQDFLAVLEDDNPAEQTIVITASLSSHASLSTRDSRTKRPRITQVLIPKNAC
jgi:hypothetical protein